MRGRRDRERMATLAAILALLTPGGFLSGQQSLESRGSANIEVLAHLPLGPNVTDIEIEQDLSRPYAYVAREDGGLDIIDLHDPENPTVLHRWRIGDTDLQVGSAGTDIKAFQWAGRNYVVHAVQFRRAGPDSDLGAVIFDVTGLPDVSTFREVARLQGPQEQGGFHNVFAYRHSNGRALLFATRVAPHANVYDLGYLIEGRSDALVARIPLPPSAAVPGESAYHDFYIGYHADSGQDRFYGGGTGGYYVYNVTDLESPELLVSLTGIDGVRRGHTFTPSPDGLYAVTETEYRYAPLRIFDLKPGLDGVARTSRRPISAWTADWRNLVHNHEVRWPYVFVSGYLDGLQVFSLVDPEHPTTVAYYDTYLASSEDAVMMGAWGIDVRNADGLIVLSDMVTGFWAFRMEDFQGWNGLDWGVPNISSVQDWENGPQHQAFNG